MGRPEKDLDFSKLHETAMTRKQVDAIMERAAKARAKDGSVIVRALASSGYRELAEVAELAVGSMQKAARTQDLTSPRTPKRRA